MSHALPYEKLPELLTLQPPSVRLAPNDRVRLPDVYTRLIDTAVFQRLRGVRQLGYVDRVYPDATHSRFAHSLGVFGTAVGYVQALWQDQQTSFFRDTFKYPDIRKALVAALLHDIGQYPNSHVLEDTERTAEGFLSGSMFDHENYTRLLLTDFGFLEDSLGGGKAGHAAAVEFHRALEGLAVTGVEVAGLLKGDLTRPEESVLRAIIDGPIDADKMDYLRRDAHHAGVAFGVSIDAHRFYESLTCASVEKPDGDEVHALALTEKGRAPAEQLLVARGHMFREVYWHKTVRAHEAVLAAAVARLRPSVEGFETWFRRMVLSPSTTDDWFVRSALSLVESGKHEDMHLLADKMQPEERAAVVAHLKSVLTTSGRTAYKTLLTVTRREDDMLYDVLQDVRDVSLARRENLMNELIGKFAARAADAGLSLGSVHEIVLDVPARRSPANTGWLVEFDEVGTQSTVTLGDASEMWAQFGRQFHDQARHVRVFVPWAVRERVKREVRNGDAILRSCLRDAAVEVGRRAVQLELGV